MQSALDDDLFVINAAEKRVLDAAAEIPDRTLPTWKASAPIRELCRLEKLRREAK